MHESDRHRWGVARGLSLVLEALIESQRQFEHFLAAVERIPEIETDDVRELVEVQLLKEPGDYVVSVPPGLGSDYESFDGVKLRLPKRQQDWPHIRAKSRYS